MSLHLSIHGCYTDCKMHISTYTAAIVDATSEVLSTMAGMQPLGGEPAVKKDAQAWGDVTGIISLVSSSIKVSIAVTMTKPVVIAILKRMAQIESNGADDVAISTAGEIANMVAGVAQRSLESVYGCCFSISLPTVVSGENHQVIHKFEGKTTVIPFYTDSGTFFVEFCCTAQ